MEKMENKYHMVTYDKEDGDTRTLIEKVKQAGFIYPDMLIINCFPEYSSRLVHMVNHSLSHLNKHELFEVIDLKMPYPNMGQVWDNQEKSYRGFTRYLMDWIRLNINSHDKYLFLSTEASCNNFLKLKSLVKSKLEYANFLFASIYTHKERVFTPDIYVQEHEGRVLFQWENVDNPNK